VDVDILFTENATIGEKVQLSEKIIHVMRSMRCPHPLQANQIQGSDWAKVLPVIAWLIQKFFENRELTAKQLRLFAHLQFGKHYALPHEDRDPRVDSGLPDVMRRYRAQRRFKLKEVAGKKQEASRVHSVLLEYGETLKARYGLAGSGADGEAKDGEAKDAAGGGEATAASVLTFGVGKAKGDDKQLSAFERKLAAAARKAAEAEAELALEMAQEEDSLREGMLSVDGHAAGGANSKRVGSIVGLGAGEIGAAAARYQESVEEARRRVEEMGEGAHAGGVAAFRRQKAALEKRAAGLAPEVAAVEAAKREAEAALAGRVAALEARQAQSAANGARLAELAAEEEASGMSPELAKLKGLVLLNEQLKQQESAFKVNVKRQLANLQAELAAADAKEAEAAGGAGAGGGGDDEGSRLREIEGMHAKVLAKYDRLRALLAERNLAVSASSRSIDDIPTRTELIQYERRFTELYAQVALKLGENKKYFETYNTLDETHRIMTKEVTLINSITDNFDAAMSSKAGKEQFLGQLQNIVKSTEQSLDKQKATLSVKAARLEDVQAAHQALVDEQRRYFKAVKDFQEECNKNELYSAKLAEMSAGR